MNRRLFFLGMTGVAGCSRPAEKRLNVFNWSSYVAPETIPGFERETGIRVRYGLYESNEEMLARVLTGNSGWDVAFPTGYMIGPLRENRLLARLDHGRLPGLRHLDESFRRPEWDRELEWCVPYMWGATGIICNRQDGPTATRWADLWDGRLRGRLTMMDDPAEVLGACLKKQGDSVNATEPVPLRAAQAWAVRQKPLVRAYLNAEVRDQVIAGDVLTAQMWATIAQQAIDAAPHLQFVYPAEGYSLYADNVVVLRESRRPEFAHAFLDYLLRPEVAARIAVATRNMTVNGAARQLLPAALRENRTLYPPPEVLARGEYYRTMPAAAQRLRDRLWTEIKSA